MSKRKRRKLSDKFKENAVKLITEQGVQYCRGNSESWNCFASAGIGKIVILS